MSNHPLRLAVLAALAAPATLFAPTAYAQAAEDETGTLDRIIVTGTRVTDRTVAESASPIDIISPETLEATGTTELATALSRALPSLNFPRPAISDGTDAVRPAQLRGLAPDQVLVLVNGKRRHATALINLNGTQGRGSSPVDLNAIPMASIERVEVLRDGASAQYGSDAIAGVINIVLKGADHGGSIATRVGQHSAGDGESWQVSGNSGFALGERGAVHLAAQALHNDQTDRARPFIGTPTATSAPPGRVVQRQGDPEIEQYAVSYNTRFAPAEGVSFYSFGNASRRDALSNGFYRPAGDSRNVPQIYPDGFLPRIRNIAEDRAFVVGMKSETAGGLGIDLSYNYGHSDLSFGVENSLNRSFGAASQTRFKAGALEVTQHVLNLDLTRAIDVDWLEYPIAFAFGGEWRGEDFAQHAGEPNSYLNGGVLLPGGAPAPSGSQVFPGFRPADARAFDRHSYSVYADVEADLGERVSLGLAGRTEQYSDFGNTSSGKVSARWAITDQIALRGTLSTGFRAPSLQQQFFQSTATNFISVPGVGTVPFDIRTFRVNDPAAIALGAEPLRAEESRNASLGLVVQPFDGLYITVDAYRIRIEDRIALSENLTSAAVRNYLNNNGFPDVGGGRYFTNAIDTTTDGVDVIATWNMKFGNGGIDWTTGYNYNKTEIDRIAANPAALAAIDPTAVRFGRTEVGRLTVGAPRDKFFLGGVWHAGAWTFGANATRFGRFSVLGATPALDQTFAAKWTLDLSATWKLDRWDFTLGADNVLDEYPDEVIFANSTGGQLPYSASSPFGFNGAFVYAKVGYGW
ncbi:TonB-dependent receptor plug domain-containing protein [Montanilutibacter psychrotolerans]|uniref:TonB-dependent receptor n=1 Tax=Montanilutibacter psychrotolerans TaxID=1327343 RepID=A0A3M8SSD4_9GAMM|nr:TonB-dependent receptor [Lysobacter psychrotolerans]RNF84237.1 TonB-dependent receptor [Lysobacter psychrotolerans]